MNQEQAALRVERPRCPYCHEDVSPADRKSACASCMAWHHEDCWGEHGGCSACGDRTATGRRDSRGGPPETAGTRSVEDEVASLSDDEVGVMIERLERLESIRAGVAPCLRPGCRELRRGTLSFCLEHAYSGTNAWITFGVLQLGFWIGLGMAFPKLLDLVLSLGAFALVFIAAGVMAVRQIRRELPGLEVEEDRRIAEQELLAKVPPRARLKGLLERTRVRASEIGPGARPKTP